MEDKDTSLEVLCVCESSSQPWPVNFYNPLTGAAVWSYKGVEMNEDEPQDALLVNKDYLLIATVKKSMVLQVGFESKNRTLQKSFLSSPLQCLAVSSDGTVCCGSIDKNLYTWILSSGKLCSIVTGHLQAITRILFTSDDSKVVTSGKDGSILAWNLEDLLLSKSSMNSTSNVSPWRKFNSHSLGVTDMKLGRGGGACRIYSVSSDQTAQIHDLCSGDLLMTLRFDCSLTSCAIDNAENQFYIGSSKGDILRVCLSEEPVLRERHLDFVSNTEDKWLKAHKESVAYLSVNIDGTLLASGGDDNEVKIWHVASRQCIRTIHCKGKPKRVDFHVKFPALSGNCQTQLPVVHPLQKVVNEKADENLVIRLFGTASNSIDERKYIDQLMDDLLEEEKLSQFKTRQAGQDDRDLSQDIEHLRRELAKTKKINKHLYDMCVNFSMK